MVELHGEKSGVQSDGTSFGARPTEQAAVHNPDDKASVVGSPRALLPQGSAYQSSRKRYGCTDFHQVLSWRKSLMDESAKTFESCPLAESRLPPSPVRDRKVSLPGHPSMPALPSKIIEARQYHDMLSELEVQVVSIVPAKLSNLTPASPICVRHDRVMWLVGAKLAKSQPFTIPGCSEASCLHFRQRAKRGLGCNRSTLALRGWQPRTSCVLAAFFMGEKAMAPREWKGPVMDESFPVEISEGRPLICGFVFRVVQR